MAKRKRHFMGPLYGEKMKERFIDGVFAWYRAGNRKANDPIAWQGDGGNGLEDHWAVEKLTVFPADLIHQ